MSKFDVLDQLVKEGNGYLRTSLAMQNHVSRPTLADYARARNMERVGNGLYLAADAWQDELYQLHLLNSRIVFSHETALMLLGLTEQEPSVISVTVKAGYNASHLRKQGIRVYQVKPEVYKLGVTQLKTVFGNPVCVYNRERTICDILLCKNSMDIQIFRYAMKEYMAQKAKNLNRLMAYAKVFGIEDTVRLYTEVML